MCIKAWQKPLIDVFLVLWCKCWNPTGWLPVQSKLRTATRDMRLSVSASGGILASKFHNIPSLVCTSGLPGKCWYRVRYPPRSTKVAWATHKRGLFSVYLGHVNYQNVIWTQSIVDVLLQKTDVRCYSIFGLLDLMKSDVGVSWSRFYEWGGCANKPSGLIMLIILSELP